MFIHLWDVALWQQRRHARDLSQCCHTFHTMLSHFCLLLSWVDSHGLFYLSTIMIRLISVRSIYHPSVIFSQYFTHIIQTSDSIVFGLHGYKLDIFAITPCDSSCLAGPVSVKTFNIEVLRGYNTISSESFDKLSLIYYFYTISKQKINGHFVK